MPLVIIGMHYVDHYLTDVAGYVTNVGRTTQQKTGSRTLDFYLANQRLVRCSKIFIRTYYLLRVLFSLCHGTQTKL